VEKIIFMPAVKLSVKRRAAATVRLTVGIVMASQLLGATGVQEPVQPRIDEQFEKQENIYQRRGAGSYTANRGLSKYAEVLPSGFCDALAGLGSSDRWLDIGAGEGHAILDYYAAVGDVQKCVRPGPKARAVAISIEDRRTDKWKQQAASLGDRRIQYLFGKHLSDYSPAEL